MSVAGAGHRFGEDTSDAALRRSMEYCRSVTRSRARNFYYGLKLTPEPKRSALYAVYAFMRACDDLADAAAQSGGAEAGVRRIEAFTADLDRVLAHGPLPVGDFWPAFAHVVHHYPIDPSHLRAMLDGQRQDLTHQRYATFAELERYCYRVAGVVGLVCISVWGYTSPAAAEEAARHRGTALQLTNILRDLREDADRGRVYLPLDELAAHSLDADAFLAMVRDRRPDERFDRLMAFQVQRARSYYEKCDELDALLEASCRPTSWAIMRIYRGLLEKIARDPRKVLTRRIRLSSFTKAMIALRAVMKR